MKALIRYNTIYYGRQKCDYKWELELNSLEMSLGKTIAMTTKGRE